MIHDAHAFRGEYIDLCAQIEHWAAKVLQSDVARRSGKAKKVPPMLGPKLDRIKELAADDVVFARPARIRKLLAQIQPLAQLRADLAHATLSVSTVDGKEIFVFELPIAQPAPHFTGRFWLKSDELPKLISMLKQRRKELNDQKLKG